MKLYAGCDPGINGCVAFIPESGEPWFIKMPETHKDLLDALMSVREHECFAYLEKVSSSPGMGVVSAFTFGLGYGALQMALLASGIPFEKVRPQEWQKAMGCMTGGQKNISKAKAQELFPTIKCTHINSDALLIAEHCRRTRK